MTKTSILLLAITIWDHSSVTTDSKKIKCICWGTQTPSQLRSIVEFSDAGGDRIKYKYNLYAWCNFISTYLGIFSAFCFMRLIYRTENNRQPMSVHPVKGLALGLPSIQSLSRVQFIFKCLRLNVNNTWNWTANSIFTTTPHRSSTSPVKSFPYKRFPISSIYIYVFLFFSFATLFIFHPARKFLSVHMWKNYLQKSQVCSVPGQQRGKWGEGVGGRVGVGLFKTTPANCTQITLHLLQRTACATAGCLCGLLYIWLHFLPGIHSKNWKIYFLVLCDYISTELMCSDPTAT